MAGDAEWLLLSCLWIVAETPPQVDPTANQIGNNQCLKCQRQHGNRDRHSAELDRTDDRESKEWPEHNESFQGCELT